MALRLPFASCCLLAASLLGISATCAAHASPSADPTQTVPAANGNAAVAWTDRVQIEVGPGKPFGPSHPADLNLRIVTPKDSASLNRTGLAKVFGDNRPQYFLRNELPGMTVMDQPSPAMVLIPTMLRPLLESYFRFAPDAMPKEHSTLHVNATRWALIHQGNRTDNPLYRLHHMSMIDQQYASGARGELVICSDEDRSATLEQWQADDYALLKQSALRLSLACQETVARKMQLFFPRPLAIEDLGTYADGAVPPARVRVFGGFGRRITMYTDAACHNDYRAKIDVRRSKARPIDGLSDSAPENLSIGIPITDTVRNMKSMEVTSPNYQEYEVEGGKPLIFEARYENSSYYYCEGRLSQQFVARPGQDYEVEMTVSDDRCYLHVRQVHADGTVSQQQARPTPASCERVGAPARIEPRQDMQVLLFSPGQLQIQDAAGQHAPQQLSDDASSSQALQNLLQQAADTPGTRLCVIVPGGDYSSVLHDAVRERVLEAPQVLPSLWEEAATVNRRRGAEPDAPLDLDSVVERCNAFKLIDFAAH